MMTAELCQSLLLECRGMTTTGAGSALTIDELSAVTGLSVRTTRYYASLGLIPPPERRGRIAYYGLDHQARLELVTALQEHGFTLQAIERYLGRLPADITPADLAMQRAMITSWTSESAEEVYRRIGRELHSLGLPNDALAAAHETIARHMDTLAVELTALMREEVLDPFKRTRHTEEEARRLDVVLPRLRELTAEAITVSFQDAANRFIGRGLALDD
jgi:DNA-binding transcriptional MerR regulator